MSKIQVFLGFLILVPLVTSWAQELERRIITIEAPGGGSSGNIRTGPVFFSHPEPEGVVATVSTLTIFAQFASLRAPEGMLMNEARGQREASFDSGVRVARGRLTALGPELVYSEATGLGVLAGPASITVAPRDEEDDRVDITANEVTFDVDTDISTSRGDVRLVSGRSTGEAQTVTYEEERELARLVSEGAQVVLVRQGEEDELVITADEVRVLTREDRLLARGNVTLRSGNTVSTGDTVYFDDENSRAEIIGNPAVSVNDVDGVRVSGARLEHRTDLDVVSVLDASLPSAFNVSSFVMAAEAQD